jgi:hypothetical protein
MPYRPSPSPRRWSGTSEATSALPTTTVIAKPRPRTTLTARIAARFPAPGSASAGAPSSSRPAASVSRYPNLATRRGVTSSAPTVANISAAVASPAPIPLAPTEVANSGTTDSSR